MRYINTRGSAASVDFEGALFAGYAADGGLFMPEKLPFLDYTTLQKWSNFSYSELVKQLCSIFISPELIPPVELNGKCKKDIKFLKTINIFWIYFLKKILSHFQFETYNAMQLVFC